MKPYIIGGIIGILLGIIVVLMLRKKEPVVELSQFQIDQLKYEMKGVILHEFDSLRTAATIPVETTNDHADSLREVEHAENNKIIYELRKKRNATIDTLGSDELARIFASYR